MSRKSLTALEEALMKLLLAGEDPVLEVLRGQLEVLSVSSRQVTPMGFFTSFSVRQDALRVEHPNDLVLDDVGAEIVGLEPGPDFQLFVSDGVLDSLECAVFEGEWPREPELVRAFYLRVNPRESGSLLRTDRRDLEALREDWPKA